MSQYCQGEVKCDANQFCGCLPEGIEVVGSTTIESEGWKVEWNNMIVAHCRTPKQALAKARKLNKAAGIDVWAGKYIAVRVTKTTKTEVLKETEDETKITD